ncbi:MAG: XRE family transcriptional regulator [Mariniphaga sp.]
MNTVFAQRIATARKMAGLSMDQLSSLSGLSKNAISRYEKGVMKPDSSNLIKLSKALNVKVDYLLRKPTVELEAVEFRKKARLGIKSIDSIKYRVMDRLERYLELEDILSVNNEFINPISSFQIDDNLDVEKAASKLRETWNLGLNPISSVIEMLEDNFIKVVEVDEPLEFDGLSAFVGKKVPVIVVNQNFPVERKRFTLLHELGHLLLTLNGIFTDKEIENLCNSFAGAILIPEAKLISELGQSRKQFYLQELADLQKEWGISIQAIMYRAKNLGIISQAKLTDFYFKLRQNSDFKKQVDESRYRLDESSFRFNQLLYKGLAQELISISKASVLSAQSENTLKASLCYI